MPMLEGAGTGVDRVATDGDRQRTRAATMQYVALGDTALFLAVDNRCFHL
jgi:hypothetical protein